MKPLLKHVDESEKIGNGLKDLLKTRSSIVMDFSEGFNAIFWDDVMFDDIINAIAESMHDEHDLITTWVYEYRLMGWNDSYMEVSKSLTMEVSKSLTPMGEATMRWDIGSDPEDDEENLGLLWDAVTEWNK